MAQSYKHVAVGFPPKKGTPDHEKVIKSREKAGSSNAGDYPGKKYYAGPAGGAAAYSYPIDTKSDAESALKLAHNAPNPAGIKRAVFERFPALNDKKKSKRSVGAVRAKAS